PKPPVGSPVPPSRPELPPAPLSGPDFAQAARKTTARTERAHCIPPHILCLKTAHPHRPHDQISIAEPPVRIIVIYHTDFLRSTGCVERELIRIEPVRRHIHARGRIHGYSADRDPHVG